MKQVTEIQGVEPINYKVYLFIDDASNELECSEHNFIFSTIGQARKKIKELYNTIDHDIIILLSIWKVTGVGHDEYEEGLNSKYNINQLDNNQWERTKIG